MSGEKNLDKLLKAMKPKLNSGDYVFCSTTNLIQFENTDILFLFKEEEGTTIVLKKALADKLGLEYSFVASWITLTVYSSLESVGLTAAFSKALTDVNVSCNVVAGYYHDHIFVDKRNAEKAMETLNFFCQKEN